MEESPSSEMGLGGKERGILWTSEDGRCSSHTLLKLMSFCTDLRRKTKPPKKFWELFPSPSSSLFPFPFFLLVDFVF